MGTCAQIASQVPAEISASLVHGSWSFAHASADGQAPGAPAAIAVSQVSPTSTAPLPHVAGQSASSALVAPLGQHLSPATRAVISWYTQRSWQPWPTGVSVVHAMPSSQVGLGQAPGAPAAIAVSQVSPTSMRPLPQ